MVGNEGLGTDRERGKDELKLLRGYGRREPLVQQTVLCTSCCVYSISQPLA